MDRNAEVICAGIVVVDHVAAPIDRLPAAGELVLTDECFLTIGGCAANVAVDLAKQGIAVNVCCLVGDDPLGAFASEFLQSHGVDCADLKTMPGAATSQTLIVNVKGQDRRFIHHLGANRHFSGRHFPRDRIRRAKALYVGGYFLMESLEAGELAEVFREARKAGVKTMLDVVIPGPGDYMPALEIILPETDVFHCNEDEGRAICAMETAMEQADALHRAGAAIAVVTRGGEGAALASRSVRLEAAAHDVEFVDGTGGGDAFDAGWIRGLIENADLRQCLRYGSGLGASCVRRSGATSGVFSREELDAFLSANPLAIREC